MKKRLLIATLTVAVLLGGCVVAPYDTYPVYGDPVYVEPPPPRVEYPGYAPGGVSRWCGGSGTGRPQQLVGDPGGGPPPRPGYRWIEPRWERDGRNWRQQRGGWQPEHHPQVAPAPGPRYERREAPRPEPVPQYRQERGYQSPAQPAPAQPAVQPSAPRREMENRQPPAQEMGRRGPPEMRTAPEQRGPGAQRDDRGRGEPRDERRSRRRDDDDRR